MKREDIERKLDTAVSGMIPEDMFKRISENIVSVDAERIEKGMKRKFNIFGKGFVGVAAAACLLFAVGVVGVPYYGNNYVPDSHVDIDVNPGVEIVTNKKNKVLQVQSTNQDGAAVIDGMNLKNTELKVAVNALIGSMVQKGYIRNDNTGILVTVRNDNEDKANKVKAEVSNDINTALSTNSVQATVINQTVKTTVDAKKFATENNISIGKAVFVLNLAAKDSSLDAKELAKMKVSEIANLVVQKGIDIRDIVDYDSDDSIWENIADAIEDIDEDAREKGIATSAAVENTTVSAATAAQPATTQPQTAAPTQAATQPQSAAPTQAAASGISADRAKQIALSHAGVGGANFTKVELDTDDGVRVYEIEFKVGNVEYDYDIDASSGAIISSSSEIDD
ncbi:PepSY domain-containing protein [Lachnoanaerobaculum gingivalis]|uniref:PepSY domain-containing protein n=1 Tax=Lachnoanaerobaculum gingivalis TaxID=2490855 RepID=UPI0024A6DBB5|nr:PepSY domain-containing protein [Lachnoanaerobaculum gingivalis]WHE87961.1 PepSY domain-containing protein [Lachnoanaerobaculum gingivalis]